MLVSKWQREARRADRNRDIDESVMDIYDAAVTKGNDLQIYVIVMAMMFTSPRSQQVAVNLRSHWRGRTLRLTSWNCFMAVNGLISSRGSVRIHHASSGIIIWK
jgi:hypothetical protein